MDEQVQGNAVSSAPNRCLAARVANSFVVMMLVVGACGGEIAAQTSSEPPDQTICEVVKAHVESCDPHSSIDCNLGGATAVCERKCDAQAPCSAISGEDEHARAQLLDCKSRCSCFEFRDFLTECGGDTAGILCENAKITCPCPFSRTCGAVMQWRDCCLSHRWECFGELPLDPTNSPHSVVM